MADHRKDMKSSFVDWALLVVPGVIWGASFLFIAEGLAAVEPNGVTFTRIAIGFLTLSLFPSARKPVARADWAGTAALGVLWFAFPLSMFPFAEQHVSSALTGMLNGATPLCVAAVATLIARRLPERGTLAGLAIGFGGAVVMALPALGGSSSAFGVGLIVAALVLVRHRAQRRAAAAAAQRRHSGHVARAWCGVDSHGAARIAGGAERSVDASSGAGHARPGRRRHRDRDHSDRDRRGPHGRDQGVGRRRSSSRWSRWSSAS